MNIDNIVYSDEMGAACLTIAMLPYINEQIMKEHNLSDLGDVAVVLYLDLLDRFSRFNSSPKNNRLFTPILIVASLFDK